LSDRIATLTTQQFPPPKEHADPTPTPIPLTPPVTATTSAVPPATARATVGSDTTKAVWFHYLDLMLTAGAAPSTEIEEIRNYIQHGISFALDGSTPPPLFYDNTPAVDQEGEAVAKRLKEYIEFGAVEEVTDVNSAPHGIQPLHVILKPNKKPRIVIDLSRNLNSFITYRYFSYSALDDAVAASVANCWYGKLDLSNCFLSFPIHPDFIKFFYFKFRNKLYRYTCMPFGLAPAPRICTQLLSVASFALTQAGCPHVRYLDDFLFVAETASELRVMLGKAKLIFEQLGLVVNKDKTEGPLQGIEFLGIVVNSVQQILACSESRIQELLALLQQFIYFNGTVRRKQVESLVGKLSFAAQVLPGARPFMRHMLDCIHKCRRHNSIVRLSPNFKADVQFWLDHIRDWNGRQRWRQAATAPIIIASDASLAGFGFHIVSVPPQVDASNWPRHKLPGSGFCGRYHESHSQLHYSHTQIGWCEMLAVLAAASTYGELLRDQCVLFQVDNSGDVAILNRQSTRSMHIASLLRNIYSLSLHYNFSIKAVHIPGVTNVLADFLSRPELHENDPLTHVQSCCPTVADSLRVCSFVCSSSFHPVTSSD
jgi:hypothetical protein